MIRVVRPDVAAMDAALVGDEELSRALGHDVARGWATFRDALRPSREVLAGKPVGFAWGTRFFVTDEPHELVGWGGFKGVPKAGVVELGYVIAECRRGARLRHCRDAGHGRGGVAEPAITTVIAHTQRERNASNRVLEKVGFSFDTTVVDDSETVWRFTLDRRSAGWCAATTGSRWSRGHAATVASPESSPRTSTAGRPASG